MRISTLIAEVCNLAVNCADRNPEMIRVCSRDFIDGDCLGDFASRLSAQRVRQHRMEIRDKRWKSGHRKLPEKGFRNYATAKASRAPHPSSRKHRCRGQNCREVDASL
jgi:hypothetical protein